MSLRGDVPVTDAGFATSLGAGRRFGFGFTSLGSGREGGRIFKTLGVGRGGRWTLGVTSGRSGREGIRGRTTTFGAGREGVWGFSTEGVGLSGFTGGRDTLGRTSLRPEITGERGWICGLFRTKLREEDVSGRLGAEEESLSLDRRVGSSDRLGLDELREELGAGLS